LILNPFNRFVVGLTGGIGSGKSTAAKYFEKLGAKVINADVVARDSVSSGSQALLKIRQHFGEKIVDKKGKLDRSKLREIIFDNTSEKLWLENLLHPIIREKIILDINNASESYVLLESPLLFETNQYKLVNVVLLIDVPEELQVIRASQRDKSTSNEIKKIIKTQMPRSEKIKLSTYIADNTKSEDDLRNQVEYYHKKFSELGRSFCNL
jgi:dephospho-CoA kinase